jgi:hypothetical protein
VPGFSRTLTEVSAYKRTLIAMVFYAGGARPGTSDHSSRSAKTMAVACGPSARRVLSRCSYFSKPEQKERSEWQRKQC